MYTLYIHAHTCMTATRANRWQVIERLYVCESRRDSALHNEAYGTPFNLTNVNYSFWYQPLREPIFRCSLFYSRFEMKYFLSPHTHKQTLTHINIALGCEWKNHGHAEYVHYLACLSSFFFFVVVLCRVVNIDRSLITISLVQSFLLFSTVISRMLWQWQWKNFQLVCGRCQIIRSALESLCHTNRPYDLIAHPQLLSIVYYEIMMFLCNMY